MLREPMTAENNNENRNAPDANRKLKTALWCVIACLAVAIIVIIVTNLKSLSEYNSLVDKYNELVEQKLSLDADKQELSSKVDAYTKQVDDLQKHVEDSEKQIGELQNKVSDLKNQLKDSKSTLYEAIKNFTPERQYKDFFASAEVLVVKKGEKETINIFLNHQGNVEWEWDDERVSIGYRYGDWHYDKAIPYFSVEIEGLKAGVNTYTFKNSATTEKVKTLVIVIE